MIFFIISNKNTLKIIIHNFILGKYIKDKLNIYFILGNNFFFLILSNEKKTYLFKKNKNNYFNFS
jgi:hypothetical protein